MSDIGTLDSSPDEYRSLHRLSLVAFGLGLGSVLALVGPLLWLFPIVAIGLGIRSLRTIAANPTQLTGRTWAVLGLLLGLFFGGLTVSRYLSERTIVYTHARECADRWFDLVKHNQTYFAHQLSLKTRDRYRGSLELKQYYANELHLRTGWQAFFDAPPLKDILAARGKCQFVYVGPVEYSEPYDDLVVVMRYRVQYELNGKSHDIPVRVEVRRDSKAEKPIDRWRFSSVKLEKQE